MTVSHRGAACQARPGGPGRNRKVSGRPCDLPPARLPRGGVQICLPGPVRAAGRRRGPGAAGSPAFSPHRARGAAIVTVLLIVTLATVVVSSLFWREHVAVRSVENRLAMAQTRWIERGAIDYARLILALDRRQSVVDHASEPWATPVQDTRLDETITGGARLDDRAQAPALLAGQIQDAQARINLNNLVSAGTVDRDEVEAFERLLVLLGRPKGLAENLVARLQRAQPPVAPGAGAQASAQGAAPGAAQAGAQAAGQGAGTQAGQAVAAAPTALRMKRLADLLEVPGFDRDTVQALEPFAIFLPTLERTLVNINTAPAEVIAARVPQLDGNLAAARAFVERRQRQTYYNSVADASQALSLRDLASLPQQRWSVASSYFVLRGVIRFERVVSRTDTLLARRGNTQNVEVEWQDRY